MSPALAARLAAKEAQRQALRRQELQRIQERERARAKAA